MAEGDDLGHVRISNRKALAAGLTCRPLLTTARDTLAWRASDAVPEAIRTHAALRAHARAGDGDADGVEGEGGEVAAPEPRLQRAGRPPRAAASSRRAPARMPSIA